MDATRAPVKPAEVTAADRVLDVGGGLGSPANCGTRAWFHTLQHAPQNMNLGSQWLGVELVVGARGEHRGA